MRQVYGKARTGKCAGVMSLGGCVCVRVCVWFCVRGRMDRVVCEFVRGLSHQ